AASRFCCWLRRALEAIRTHPSPSSRAASRSTASARVPSSSATLRPGFHSSAIRVLEVFTCCPPAPPAREARYSSSHRGIATVDVTSSEPSLLIADLLCGPVVQRTGPWQNARIDPPDPLWHFARRAV